ncbi:telomeric repeat-binding factor 2-interacting protein 1-like isoform X2 [Montipora foliosa]|uniref:telomeric repeat-binding factor 2-interacting protein 1-like isoform X2 n=1 Tax=Montipora foliosa TaxID=591990 RepID=UPI0035F1F7ED
MADSSKFQFPKCSTLFLTEDGSPMIFYMIPCSMKTKLRPLIDHGGGELSSSISSNSIKLVDPAVAGSNASGYISTEYIFDCIKHNKLQDIEKYRLKSTSSNTNKGLKSQAKASPSNVKVSGPNGSGRSFYSDLEDLALMEFVKEHKDIYSLKGNNLYKEAEKTQVTSHSWQSMRDHYLKVLHKRKKPKNLKQLLFKSEKEKPTKPHKEMKNLPAGQSRQTRSQTASPRKKLHAFEGDSTDEDSIPDQSRKTRSQTASPTKKLRNTSGEMDPIAGQSRKTRLQTASPTKKSTNDGKQSAELAVVTGSLQHVASEDSADDERSSGEDVDYDKLFDENLLKLAAESKNQEDGQRFGNGATEERRGIIGEHRVSPNKDGQRATRIQLKKQAGSRQDVLSDFEGEIVAKEDLKRSSVYDDEDKRPMAKKSKENGACPTNERDSQVNEKLARRFLELQLDLQRLESKWTVPQIIHALLVTSGKLEDATSYLQNDTVGKEQWTLEEDKILLSKNKEAISSLTRTRGLQSVVDRMNFMEGIS